MTKLNQPYGIGLDIGSNSIGFAVVDANSHLLRLKGETAIGARLFREGQSAADRRGSRTTRRRLSRTRWRLSFLRDFFAPHITKIDPDFFLRQKYSEISPKDKDKFKYEKRLFNDRTDAEFYEDYPSMYHLRLHLMTHTHKADPREIFLAIHHILKSRGHFLTPGAAKDFNTDKVDLEDIFPALTEAYAQVYPDLELTFDLAKADDFKAKLLDEQATPSDTQKALVNLLLSSDGEKEIVKKRKQVLTEFAKAITGLKTKFNLALGTEVDEADASNWQFSMGQLDDKWSNIETSMTDQGTEIFEQIQELYRARLLNGIVPAGMSLSQAKVADYGQHKEDLELFKTYLKKLNDHELAKTIRGLYDRYINGDDAKPFLREDFVKALTKEVTAHPNEVSEQLLNRMGQANFMLKQRTKANGAIPIQLQQRELDQIIANQSKYYDWLAAPNPVEAHRWKMPYQLDELLNFHIPYYVGPLITPKQQAESGENVFAWMVRKDPSGNITPYNFDEKVDREASANTFIQRMKTTDTYLIGEDVLPKQSLLYQKYEVLNELNNVRINNECLGTDQKQRLIREVFERHSSVTIKQVADNLVAHGDFARRPEIRGLADEKRFLSSLSTYHQLKEILHEAIDDPTKLLDIENIITWSTVFEDHTIFETKLAEIEWLDPKKINELSGIRYRGWGQFSRKLLDGLKLGNGHTVIQELMLSNHNLMQILADETLKETMTELNQDKLKTDDIEDVINDAYTSPSNKKALRQVLRVVEDIKHAANGQDPSWLFIETADGTGTAGKRTQSRQKQIQTVYANAAQELIDSAVRGELEDKIADKASFTDRLVLYFMQGGRDIYTGAPLNIDQLSHYDIDHILPQSLIKDDSLDNRVLVNATINREKNNVFASTLFAGKMKATWRKWHEAGLISGRKLRNLMLRPDEIDKFAKGFVARQLVETRQIIKLTEQIAAAQYPNTKIIAVKAGLSHQLREELDFPKNRDVNHYHHAFDAFLAARIGTYLLKRYPKLAPFFTYGEFAKVDVKKFREFNFIGALTHAKKNIIAKDTGEIVWDKERDIRELDRIYNFKRMLITHEVYFETADLFKQTIYAAKDSKERGGSKQLIPKKQGYPTQVYGGYTQESGSYNALVRVAEADTTAYQVIKISAQNASKIASANLKSREKGKQLLNEIVVKQLAKRRKNWKPSANSFKIVIPRFGMGTLFQNAKYGLFMVNSDTYYRNYQELWLSRENQKLLKKLFSIKYEKTQMNHDALQVYKAIIDQVEKFFKLYDINQFRAKLSDAIERFEKLPINTDGNKIGKTETLRQILIGLQANGTRSNVKNLGIKTDLGLLQVGSGIKLDKDTQIVYQSPSGLFKRRIPLADL
ncbi:type II CRISPR RNA-guided endonuclease Cas9 [Lacticaseibacillus rhamnosus]|uniref:type II CRISPR RNA-guided endonuclease Cas9 n=1 Tax=Lacticaseibacillus rhamnosus TaxID=47715 RepID=UPI00128EC565|nr:type II CRISPR RNA-guided endonuclease Cas9 [Lacticaseibacillus rhamnosus]QFV10577.1 type II CRISPR RNA-guided endonuclease Cas9 [Lacticaseibacillus rhamnosus]